MHTLIIGAGAMGSYFAYKMAKAAQSVTLYDTDSEKVERINRQEVKIRSMSGEDKVLNVPAVNLIDDAPPADLIMVMVKAYNTARAAREIDIVKTPGTMVVTLQNGLGNVEQLARYIPRAQIFSGITYQSTFEQTPGHIIHTGSGLTIVAPQLKSANNACMDLARLLNNCDLPTGATTDLEPILWKKLIVNCAINPLSAIHNLPNGMLPKHPEVVRDMMKLVAEGVTVAQKVGVPLNYGEMWATVLDTCRSTAANRSSMLADVDAGRMTEIEAINGSIVRLGEQYSIDTPTHIQMVRQVVAIHGKNDRIRVE